MRGHAQQGDAPRTGAEVFSTVFERLPVADEEVELLVRAHVFLSAEPHRAEADFAENAHFQRAGMNAAVPSDCLWGSRSRPAPLTWAGRCARPGRA